MTVPQGGAARPPAAQAASASESLRCDGLPSPRRQRAAATVVAAIGLTVLDASCVNVALPVIARDLQASPAAAVWVANAYSLTVLTLLLPLSAMADRFGFRRLFVGGLLMFLLAALAAANADSMRMLLASRICQGVGAATISCLFGGLVRNIYPARLLARGISINAMFVGFSAVLGPVIGAAILSVAPWQWVFLFTIPIGLLALLGVRSLPNPPTTRVRFDGIGAMLSMASLGLFVYGLDGLVRHPLRALALIAVAVVLAVVLVRRSLAQEAPLMPVDLLRMPVIGFAVGASALLFASQMGTAVALPFFFLNVMQRDYLEIGVLMGGWPIGGALMAPVAARLSERHSAALLCAIGAGGMSLGLLLLMLMPPDVHNAWLLAGMVMAGVGFGFFQTPNNRAMLGAVPRQRSGAAGGIQATTRVFGQSVGMAFVAVGFGVGDASGPYLALGSSLCFALLGMVVNLVRLRSDGDGRP